MNDRQNRAPALRRALDALVDAAVRRLDDYLFRPIGTQAGRLWGDVDTEDGGVHPPAGDPFADTPPTCGSTDHGNGGGLVCTRLPHDDRWHADSMGNEWGGGHNGPIGCVKAGTDGHRYCRPPMPAGRLS